MAREIFNGFLAFVTVARGISRQAPYYCRGEFLATCRGCKLIIPLVAVLTPVAVTLALFVPSLAALLLRRGSPIFLAARSLFALGWSLLFLRSRLRLLLRLFLRF